MLLIGIRRPRFEGMSGISTVNSATLVVSAKEAGVIDLKPIRAILAEAEWIDTRPINKGGYWLKIEDFPEIFVSEVNGCFWLTGCRGLCVIADEERSKFYDYLDGHARMITDQSKLSEPEDVDWLPRE